MDLPFYKVAFREDTTADQKNLIEILPEGMGQNKGTGEILCEKFQFR
jgi:hypothetical protein